MKTDSFVKEFKDTGECKIYVDKIIKHWDKTFFISQWVDEFTLCKTSRRKFSLKIKITNEAAKYLISELNLQQEQGALRSGSTWR